jgi:hypothetical protein
MRNANSASTPAMTVTRWTGSGTGACTAGAASRRSWIAASLKSAAFGGLIAAAALLCAPALALDGCLVLLCLAAPSWSSILQCVAPVRQALEGLAHGRPFPSCSMAGAGNQGSHRWSTPPDFCPSQYTHADPLESGIRYTCDYDGAIEVDIGGALWSRTWWRMSGATVTDFSAAAKAQLGAWDTRFDDDYAAWLALQPPDAGTACTTC